MRCACGSLARGRRGNGRALKVWGEGVDGPRSPREKGEPEEAARQLHVEGATRARHSKRRRPGKRGRQATPALFGGEGGGALPPYAAQRGHSC